MDNTNSTFYFGQTEDAVIDGRVVDSQRGPVHQFSIANQSTGSVLDPTVSEFNFSMRHSSAHLTSGISGLGRQHSTVSPLPLTLTPTNAAPLVSPQNSYLNYGALSGQSDQLQMFAGIAHPQQQSQWPSAPAFSPFASSVASQFASSQTQEPVRNYAVYPTLPPHIANLRLKPHSPHYFSSDQLRHEMLQRQALTLQTLPEQVLSNPSNSMPQSEAEQRAALGLPAKVEHFELPVPLEQHSGATSTTFGSARTSVYKAVNSRDGLTYCLRRVHGFKITNFHALDLVDKWKQLQHSNLVQLREVFPTSAFGDSSLIFVYDLHAGAETLMRTHFLHASATPTTDNGSAGGFSNPFTMRDEARPFSSGRALRPGELLAENILWSYVIQLSSVASYVHTLGLACRVIDPSKVLLTSRMRLRLNGVGVVDVVKFESNKQNEQAMALAQQEDLLALGQLLLALACNSLLAIRDEHLGTSLELLARYYSSDFLGLVQYLLGITPPQNPHLPRAKVQATTLPRSIIDIMPFIGARFYTYMEANSLRADFLEAEYAKEMECGRLFRMLAKLGAINERPEFNGDAQWSETGERYELKLLRDYLFHQVDESGRPVLDMAHLITCLNKLDSGSAERIALSSRDTETVMIVSWAELRAALELSFNELFASPAAASDIPSTSSPSSSSFL